MTGRIVRDERGGAYVTQALPTIQTSQMAQQPPTGAPA